MAATVIGSTAGFSLGQLGKITGRSASKTIKNSSKFSNTLVCLFIFLFIDFRSLSIYQRFTSELRKRVYCNR